MDVNLRKTATDTAYVFVGVGVLGFQQAQVKRRDAAAFGRLMSASHRSSIENFENSTPELDALVEISCAQEGVYGARLTGGGFGGAIVALVAMSSIEKVAEAVEAAYCEKTGHNGKAYRCLIGDGALVQT